VAALQESSGINYGHSVFCDVMSSMISCKGRLMGVESSRLFKETSLSVPSPLRHVVFFSPFFFKQNIYRHILS